MGVVRQRANILSLQPSAVAKVTAALTTLKSSGAYDGFIQRHMTAAMTQMPANSQSNGAHCGPIFLPWHRATLWEIETALLDIDPTIPGLPYWRWEIESSLNGGDARKSKLWTDGYLGTDGDPANGDRVLNGPFAGWQGLIYNSSQKTFGNRTTPGLVRKLGRDPAGAASLPNAAQVTDANTYTTYDSAPYDKTVASFRNRLEGWSAGSRLHNQVHRWVGGDMLVATSPNDPVFWLHHANIDRIWWLWQNATTPRRPYLPVHPDGPVGHRSDDFMIGLLRPDWTPTSVQDIGDPANLGYQYL